MCDLTTVLAHQHEDRPQDDLATILGGRPGAQFLTHDHVGHIPDQDGLAIAIGDDGRFQIGDGTGLPGRADQQLFAIVLDIARAGIGIIAGQGLDHIVQRQPVGGQLVRVRRDMILADIAANCIHLDHAGRAQELRTDDPVLQGAQVFGCPVRPVIARRARFDLQRVHEDLAQTRGDGTHFRGHPFGQLVTDGLQPLIHQLSCEVDVGPILENHRDLGQAVAGNRTGIV